MKILASETFMLLCVSSQLLQFILFFSGDQAHCIALAIVELTVWTRLTA